MDKTKLIECPCNNNIIVYAETVRDDQSVYGFKTSVTIVGIAKMDNFLNILCPCGKKHSIKRFVNTFHNDAVKSPSPLMVEGEGAPQYVMFDLPKDTQLALL